MKNHQLLLAVSIIISLAAPSILLAAGRNNVKPAREIITLLNRGKYKEVISRFDSTMKMAAPEARLKAVWSSLIKETGKFQKELGDSTFQYKGYDIVIVTCKFTKSEQDIRLVFDKDGKVAGLFFSRHPEDVKHPGREDKSSKAKADPAGSTGGAQSEGQEANYISKDVTFRNEKAGVTLAGTLTLPDSTGKFPAVLLIPGSGPQDRNETVAGHQIFLVLADYLTQHGIAVLRVDDRGVGESTGNFETATLKDFASDALAAVNYLSTVRQVRRGKIGLVGHSEGGLIAPIVADESRDVSFIVLMAGPGLPGGHILMSQGALIMKANGAPDSTIRINRQLQKELFSVVETEKDSAKASARLKKILEEGVIKLGVVDPSRLKEAETFIDIQLKYLMSPWMKSFLTYNPRAALEKVKCPVLAVWGSKDLQVPPAENLPAMENALKAGGNKNFKMVELKGLNHLFQDAGTGSPSEYALIKEAISPKALKEVTDWILDKTGSKR